MSYIICLLIVNILFMYIICLLVVVAALSCCFLGTGIICVILSCFFVASRRFASRHVPIRQDRTGQDRTGQDRTGQDATRRDTTRRDATRRDTERHVRCHMTSYTPMKEGAPAQALSSARRRTWKQSVASSPGGHVVTGMHVQYIVSYYIIA